MNILLKSLFCVLEKYFHTSHLLTPWFTFNMFYTKGSKLQLIWWDFFSVPYMLSNSFQQFCI